MSTLGTGVAGVLHTLAAALGVSAILATSAAAFAVVKWLGVVYLIYLGVKTLLDKGDFGEVDLADVPRREPFARALSPRSSILKPRFSFWLLSHSLSTPTVTSSGSS